MTSGRRIILLVALAAAAIVSGGAYAYWHFLLRGPFIGETFHDFGDVPLYEETAKFEYTFRLANRLNRPLSIVAIRPECGCLTARDLKQTLQPGESFELQVTLVAKGGERIAPIRVLFDDDTQTMLRVKATGHYQPRLHLGSVASDAVTIGADGVIEFTIMLDTYETWDEPAVPTITTSPSSMTAEWLDSAWTLKFRPKEVILAPTHWERRVRVRCSGDADDLPADASIMLDLPPARPLVVPIRSATSTVDAPISSPGVVTQDQ